MKLSILKSVVVIPILFVFGCGGDGGPKPIEVQKTVPVSGIVTYKGKPLANASVIFHALDGKVAARGMSDGAGTFRLSTYSADDGAPVGTYKVTVAVSGTKEIEPGVLAPEPSGGFKSPIPNKFADPKQTDITKEVKAEGGTIKIDL